MFLWWIPWLLEKPKKLPFVWTLACLLWTKLTLGESIRGHQLQSGAHGDRRSPESGLVVNSFPLPQSTFDRTLNNYTTLKTSVNYRPGSLRAHSSPNLFADSDRRSKNFTDSKYRRNYSRELTMPNVNSNYKWTKDCSVCRKLYKLSKAIKENSVYKSNFDKTVGSFRHRIDNKNNSVSLGIEKNKITDFLLEVCCKNWLVSKLDVARRVKKSINEYNHDGSFKGAGLRSSGRIESIRNLGPGLARRSKRPPVQDKEGMGGSALNPSTNSNYQKFATQPAPQTAVIGSTVVLPCRYKHF